MKSCTLVCHLSFLWLALSVYLIFLIYFFPTGKGDHVWRWTMNKYIKCLAEQMALETKWVYLQFGDFSEKLLFFSLYFEGFSLQSVICGSWMSLEIDFFPTYTWMHFILIQNSLVIFDIKRIVPWNCTDYKHWITAVGPFLWRNIIHNLNNVFSVLYQSFIFFL